MRPKILGIRPVPLGAGNLRARFDAEMPDGIRLFNLALKQSTGGWRVFAPSAFGSAAATFTRDHAAQLVDAALTALGETRRNDSDCTSN